MKLFLILLCMVIVGCGRTEYERHDYTDRNGSKCCMFTGPDTIFYMWYDEDGSCPSRFEYNLVDNKPSCMRPNLYILPGGQGDDDYQIKGDSL